MEKLILEMENYKRDSYAISEADIKDLNTITNEINIVIKHSADKLTFDKNTFIKYFTLLTAYKEIEGFNHAINYVDSYNKENKK